MIQVHYITAKGLYPAKYSLLEVKTVGYYCYIIYYLGDIPQNYWYFKSGNGSHN